MIWEIRCISVSNSLPFRFPQFIFGNLPSPNFSKFLLTHYLYFNALKTSQKVGPRGSEEDAPSLQQGKAPHLPLVPQPPPGKR